MNRTKAIRVGCPGLKDKRTRLFAVILTCDAFTDRSDKRERNSISNENNISYTTRKVQRLPIIRRLHEVKRGFPQRRIAGQFLYLDPRKNKLRGGGG